jgi:hypothetical protein
MDADKRGSEPTSQASRVLIRVYLRPETCRNAQILVHEELLTTGYHVVLGRDKIASRISKATAKRKRKAPVCPVFTRIVALVAKEGRFGFKGLQQVSAREGGCEGLALKKVKL